LYFLTALERKISVRANRDELVQKGILLPESPLGNIPEPGEFFILKAFKFDEKTREIQTLQTYIYFILIKK